MIDVQRAQIRPPTAYAKFCVGLLLGQKDADKGDLSDPIEFAFPLRGEKVHALWSVPGSVGPA